MSRWDDIWNEKKKSHIYPLMTGAVGGVLAGGVLFGAAMKFAVPAGMVSPTVFHLLGIVSACGVGAVVTSKVNEWLNKKMVREQRTWLEQRTNEFLQLCPQYKGKEKELIEKDEYTLKHTNLPSLSDITKSVRFSSEGVFRGKTMCDLNYLQKDLSKLSFLNSVFKSRPERMAETLKVDKDELCYGYLLPLAVAEKDNDNKLTFNEKIEMYPYFKENNDIFLSDGSLLCTRQNLDILRRKQELLDSDNIVSIHVPEKCIKYKGNKLSLQFRNGEFEVLNPMVLTKGNVKSVRFSALNCSVVSYFGNSELVRMKPSALTLLKLDRCVENVMPKKITPLNIDNEKPLKQVVSMTK